MRILVLEDDVALCEGIELTLKGEGRAFTLCHDAASARRELRDGLFDLIIIDIHLPDGSGLDFCREVRGRFDTPILFLTANDTELDIITGLESGGDDYVTKPFSLSILRARVGALLRRGASGGERGIVIGGLSLDFVGMRYAKDGVPIDLSRTEQRLLHILVTNRGQTLPRETLLERVWADGGEYVDENALSVAIRRLRAKLEDEPSAPRYIKTVYGIGYTWAVGE